MQLKESGMNPAIEYDGEEMVFVDGTLSELHVAETTVNVLEQIQKRSRQKNLAKGVASALPSSTVERVSY